MMIHFIQGNSESGLHIKKEYVINKIKQIVEVVNLSIVLKKELNNQIFYTQRAFTSC